MFATRGPDCSTHTYIPAISSPLSPRSANIHGRRQPPLSCMSSAEEMIEQARRCATTPVPFAKRPVKKAPSAKADELKERRRSMFLKKVKEGREGSRFESRGEDIMRLDFVRRRRQWEAEQALQAPSLCPNAIEEEADEEDGLLPEWPTNTMRLNTPPSQELVLDEEADDVMQRENEELEALMSYLQDDQMDGATPSDQTWSDDDDYDALFSAFVQPSDGSTTDAKAEVPHFSDAQSASFEEEMDLT